MLYHTVRSGGVVGSQMRGQPFTQADDGQNRGTAQRFGKNAGVTDIQPGDLSLQVGVHHFPDSYRSAGMGADQRAHENAGLIGAGLHQRASANLKRIV